MSPQDSILSGSVIVAVLLFITRETLEFLRRRKSDLRRKAAFRRMLARECELNNVTREQLYNIFSQLNDEYQKEDFNHYYIHKNFNETISMRIKDTPPQLADYALPAVRTDVIEKLMLEVATHDSDLYEKLIRAYDSYVDMNVMRDSVIEFVETQDPFYRRNFRDLIPFNLDELVDAKNSFEALYKECTGKTEITERYR